MFTREQQQYFNQSWSAWQKLKDFLKKSVSGRSDTSGTETLCRRSDLQIQGVLTEMALSSIQPIMHLTPARSAMSQIFSAG